MTAMQYIQKLKSLSNRLASIGEPVSKKDYLIYLFNGLDQHYNGFVSSVSARSDSPSVEEIHSLLLNYEYRLEQQNTAANLDPILVNVAATSQPPFPKNNFQTEIFPTKTFLNRTLSQLQSPTSNSLQSISIWSSWKITRSTSKPTMETKKFLYY